MRNLFIISVVILLSFKLYSQDTNTVKYLPLNVGNVWVYYFTKVSLIEGGIGYDKYTITNTTQINGKTYFVFQHIHVQISGNSSCEPSLFSGNIPLRVDSATGNIYKSTNCGVIPQLLVDSLRSKIGDSARACIGPARCIDTALTNIFGANRQSKNFFTGWFEQSNNRRYVKNIGLTQDITVFMGGSCYINLRGCIINGVLYGDTTITGLKPISTEVPDIFKLYQNYPNPFNPVTKIRFDIPTPLNPPFSQRGDGGGFVTLRIYDVLGREVATLVNEELKPGTYEVQWDGTNYPSGVYFYKMTAGDFSETKKMVLKK